MTIIEIEDSLGEDLGLGLQDTLTDVPEVKFAPLAIGDTGLADLAYCNWPRALAYDLAERHPAIVIVFLGGNDCQPVSNGDTNATPVALGGTKVFDVAYSARVSALMSEATAAGARVFWVGLPIIAPDTGGEAGDTYSDCMKELNADYHLEASSHSGVTYFSTWRVFEDPQGHYAQYLELDGKLDEVRSPDGLHINGPAGTDLIGSAVVAGIEATYHIKL